MRLALLSDIHGNLQALEAVLAKIERARVDRIVCLGDIVGYGADPEACARLVRERCAPGGIVIGNHDAAAVGRTDPARFNVYARAAVEWTAGRLSPETKAWLAALPAKAVVEEMSLVHASLDRPEEFVYVFGADEAAACLERAPFAPVFVGHTHVPAAFGPAGSLLPEGKPARRISLEPGARAVVNVGSVGQPRDGCPDACWALYSTTSRTLEWRRVGYDVNEAARRIEKAGLPKKLADRLYSGS